MFFRTLFVALSFASLVHGSTNFTWNTTTNLSEASSAPPPLGKVVSNSVDTVIAVWSRYEAGWHLESAFSTNDGETWLSPETAIPPLSTLTQPSFGLALNDSNSAVLIYQTYDGSDYAIHSAYSSDGGITWTPSSSALQISSQSLSDPEIAIQSENIALAVWTGRDATIGPGSIIRTRYSDDGGATFSPSTSLSGEGASTPHVAVNTIQQAVAVWNQNGIIQSKYSVDRGGNWAPITPVSISASGSDKPCLAFTGSGNGCVAWRRSVAGHEIIEAAYTYDGGASWSSPKPLSNLSEDADNPRISMNDNGTILVVWQSDNGTHTTIDYAYSQNGGESFSPSMVLSLPNENSAHPDVSLNDDGVGSIVFTNTTENSIQSRTTTDEGVTFTALENMTFSSGQASSPSVVVNEQDHAILLWTFLDHSSFTIQSLNGEFFLLSLKQKATDLLLQRDYVNIISWAPMPDASLYRVYRDELLTDKIYEGKNLIYYDHGMRKGKTKTYYVTWADFYGEESSPAEISGP